MSLILVWVCIIGASALTLGLIYFFLAQKSHESRRDEGKPSRHTHRNKDEEVTYAKGPLEKKNKTQQIENLDVRLLDCSSIEAPSPEASPTQVDAIFIDLIRQAAELPSAVLELSSLLRQPDVPVRKIAEMVGTDPVLSARILRVANSAGVGRGKVNSLHQAIVYLGFNQVWILVNQMLTARSMQPVTKMDPVIMKTLWRHAAATATCAKHVLLELGHWNSPMGPMVMTCALLHDVGKFLLRGLSSIKKDTPQGDAEQPYTPEHILFREQKEYGINHCRIGYLLSTYWNLPEKICTTIAYHHHSAFSNWEDIPIHVKKTVLLVALSDILANLAGYAEGMPVAWRLHPEFLNELGLSSPVSSLLTKELWADLRFTEKLIEAGGM